MAIVPAAITFEDSPNMQRSIFIIPAIVAVTANGILQTRKIFNKSFPIIFITAIFVIKFSVNFHTYFFHQKSYQPFLRNEKSKEVVSNLLSLKNEYDQIIITNTPDSHYIYLLFFGKYNPQFIQKYRFVNKNEDWGFENYTFSQDTCPSGNPKYFTTNNSYLFVDAGDCTIIPKKGLKQIRKIDYSNGSSAYNFVEYKP